MPDLFPSFNVPDYIESGSAQSSQNFPKSVLFDFDSGDFVRDGAGRLIESSGYDAWVQWCIKAIATQRYDCMAYSSDYGVETDGILSSSISDKDAAEAQIASTITDALLADQNNRTKAVGYFDFYWSEDSVTVKCVATATDGATANISVNLKRGD